jgi:hypothetical protein
MKKYFKFRKDFRCNWHGTLGAFDTAWLEEQIVEYKYTDCSKHKWYNTSKMPLDNKHHYADVFLFESEGETQEYADRLRETISYVYFVKKEDEYDTIEELCDEFVDIDNHDYYKIFHENGITYAVSKTRRFIGGYDIRLEEIGQIMGAIFTDKGLIYVAKMNDKGELELL